MPKGDLKTVICMFAGLSMPAFAAVGIHSVKPSLAAPQAIGTTIQWAVIAEDTSAGPLTFRFNVARPGGPMRMVKDFNVGTYSSGTWTAPAFAWTPTGIEGAYQIQVVAKDFGSEETAAITVGFQVNPLVTGVRPVVAHTANPLVALFSAPPCAVGGQMRVEFSAVGNTPPTPTPWADCNATNTMTFEIAGMYPSSKYYMFSQTETGGNLVNGPMVSFTTGALPAGSPIPEFTVALPPGSGTDTSQDVILLDLTMPGQGIAYPEVATDLSGNILWYYYPPSSEDLLTRPLPDGILIVESGPAWNPASQQFQFLRHIDWAGNIVKETNTGAIQRELLALGASDAQPCDTIHMPATVGAACLDDFDHDFIQTLPNGYSALIADIEKIYPPGTQGDTSGLPVDIVGNMIVVLDENWQAMWYFDAFEHAGGAPQLDINRAAVLGETCGVNQLGCPPIFLLGNGIAPLALDWLHANSLYYWPAQEDGVSKGDLIWSSRHQDWVMRVDYEDGAGNGNILWRMGPESDFTFDNIDQDPWPWFSHQHEVELESHTRDLTLFDNGNTRLFQMGVTCVPNDCDSRGIVLTVDESKMRVKPMLSVDLGEYSSAVGSAQLLDNDNYFLLAGFVENTFGYSIEIQPTSGTLSGKQVFNMQGTMGYRAWRMANLYTPPDT